MSKDVAIIGASGEVVQIAVRNADYEPKPYEVVVADSAWIGGDYVGGYFYPPKPFASWTRHAGRWLAPVPMPTDNKQYDWDEDAQEWRPFV